MMTKGKSEKLFRLIDANLNRLREGIRVVEDIQRYIFDDSVLTKKLKNLRHTSRVSNYKEFLKQRDIIGDVSKHTTDSEKTRDSLEFITLSNIKRAEESARVLEECFKLLDSKEAEKFKQIRYELYDLEKQLLCKN